MQVIMTHHVPFLHEQYNLLLNDTGPTFLANFLDELHGTEKWYADLKWVLVASATIAAHFGPL